MLTLLQELEYDGLSRMTNAIDYNEGRQTHTVDFEYDALHRVWKETQDGEQVITAFDANSNPLTITYPSGRIINHEYNANNQVEWIRDQVGDIAAFTYYDDGRLETMDLPNGIQQTITYDARGFEDTRTYIHSGVTTLYSMDTDYYDKGNVKRETITNDGYDDLVKDYQYDNLDRLVSEQRDTIESSMWQYDKVGNWIQTDQNGPTETRTPNGDNEYTSITGWTTAPTYDANGNITYEEKTLNSSLVTHNYIYDWANRLIEVKDSSTQATISEYTYDALNRRVTKLTTGDGKLVTYIYNASQVIEEHKNGALARIFIYGTYIDDPIMMETNLGATYYYIKDRQYSVTAIADASGNIVETYEYSAFGLMQILDNTGAVISESSVGNPYGYTGRRWDNETGLWYYRNRMYSPSVGRFLQRDPAGFVDGMNLYAYVKNNPLYWLDPFGLTPIKPQDFGIDILPSADEFFQNEWTINDLFGYDEIYNVVITGDVEAISVGGDLSDFNNSGDFVSTITAGLTSSNENEMSPDELLNNLGTYGHPDKNNQFYRDSNTGRHYEKYGPIKDYDYIEGFTKNAFKENVGIVGGTSSAALIENSLSLTVYRKRGADKIINYELKKMQENKVLETKMLITGEPSYDFQMIKSEKEAIFRLKQKPDLMKRAIEKSKPTTWQKIEERFWDAVIRARNQLNRF